MNKRYFLVFFTYAGYKGNQFQNGSVVTDIVCDDNSFPRASWLIDVQLKMVQDMGVSNATVALTNLLEISAEDLANWKS